LQQKNYLKITFSAFFILLFRFSNKLKYSAEYLAQCYKIYVCNSSDRQKLIADGVPESKIQVVYAAIDKQIYHPKHPPELMI
jgi:hypothetical protein